MIGAMLRELAGWLMTVAALGLVWIALQYVDNRQVIEAGVVVMAATLLLRSGLSLVRLSAATRIVLRAENQSVAGGRSRPDASAGRVEVERPAP